ncbi:hypothetical protein HCZ02_06810 [Limosilactobacillus fermentum]
MAISEAQKRANVRYHVRYQKKSPDVVRRIQYKSRGKNFILKSANEQDLRQFEEWIQIRQQQLTN